MSEFNNKLVIDLFEERDALKADVVRLTLKVTELYEGAEEQKQRIQSLIEERDRANRLAEWKWNLRDEFQLLLGTDKIEEGIKAVKEMKQRIKHLIDLGLETSEYGLTKYREMWEKEAGK